MLTKFCSLFAQSCRVSLSSQIANFHHYTFKSIIGSNSVGTCGNGVGLLDARLSFPLIDQKRTKNMTTVVFKKNIAYPRRLPIFKSRPMPFKYVWQPQPPKDGEYTTRPLRAKKLGGRDPETGKVAINTIGKGVKKFYRWIDYSYLGERGENIEEKVFKVRHDPYNTALLALIASKGHQRWVIASENMKPGDIVTTFKEIPKNPIYAKEGQNWPVGALSPGTLVHRVETIPGNGGRLAQAAGTSCEIIRRAGKKIVLRIPTGQEIAIDEWCMCSVGRVSNPNHYTVNLTATEKAWWKGKRPNKGVQMRKDGYCGRKLRPPKPLQIIDAAKLITQKTEEVKLATWRFQ